jgi:hypothetical protein
MIAFLKSLFAPVKPAPAARDVIYIEGYAMEDEGEEQGSCGAPCGGCGCRD